MTDAEELPGRSPLFIHEGSVELPEGFEDRTANLFVPANTESQPNLSIARDTPQDGETLDAYVTRQIAVLKSRLAGHKLVRREAARLGRDDTALDGEQIDARYKNGGRVIHQRQAAFLIAPQRALIFSASSPRPFDTTFETLWQNWLASFVPRAETPSAADTTSET